MEVIFDVHLQSGYAVFGSGNLEVHVAQVVFVTQNVGEDGNPAVVFFDQAHGNTGNRFGHRHAGSHQRHGGAANGGHRRRTVRFQNFGYDPDGVGESVLVFGHHRMDGAPGQFAVADFAASRAAQTAAFADRKRREVVVEHKVFFVFAHQTVDNLRVFAGAEGGNHQRLGFAAGENGGTVGGRQNVDFAPDRADGFGVAAVNTLAGRKNLFADDNMF